MRKDTRNFIASAEYDIRVAEHMLKTGDYIYTVFLCHLAIEKMLKAIVAEKTTKLPPKTHNLLYLIKISEIEVPTKLFDFIAKINNASIITRYPEDIHKIKKAYPKNIARDYMNRTEEILKWLSGAEKLKR